MVIVSYARTALGKAKRGVFRNTPMEDLVAHVFKAVLDKSKIKAELIDDICMGNVLAKGAAATNCRMSQLMAGIPHTTTIHGANRLCSSGLQAVINIVNSIRAG